MSDTRTIRQATERWVSEFSRVPGSVIQKLVEFDEAVSFYDSETFRLLAGPHAECGHCDMRHDGTETFADLTELESRGQGLACAYCDGNAGDDWRMARPEYAFPCGWGTLFAPNDGCDLRWMREHADEVARLGFHVFESDDWSVLLGIDAGGFDFFEAFWIPLYRLRGLQWHK